jgi:hypothetical protein
MLRGEGYSVAEKNVPLTSKPDARASVDSDFCEKRLLFFVASTWRCKPGVTRAIAALIP